MIQLPRTVRLGKTSNRLPSSPAYLSIGKKRVDFHRTTNGTAEKN